MNQTDFIELCKYNIRDYSQAVNEERAIPDARTGLKPIHTKILYEMFIDKVINAGKFKKCAYMVGQLISRFTPHGDAATYDALVRLSQPWIQRYPLIDFHGNNGSALGDKQAAMRYTEAKLSKLAEDGILSSIDKNCVDWSMNFSNEEKEPTVLPSIFPGLFCLPNQGLGYACACNYLTFNLVEVKDLIVDYINTGNLHTIYYDVASGGTFINPQVMEQINSTGRGNVILESKYEIHDNEIWFTEFPFNKMFDDIFNELIKIYEKEDNIYIKNIRNDSGGGKLKLVVEVSNVNQINYVLNYLLDKTSLRTSYGINQVALVDGRPKQLTQKDMVDSYVYHNTNCIKREFQFELEKTLKRLDVIHGLIIAHNHIDEVIKIIREDAQPKAKLILKFNLNEIQVNAILDMRLARLSKLDLEKLLQEQEEKIEYSKYCKKIIESVEEQRQILIQRLSNLAEKYGDKRRTEVIQKDIVKINKAKKEAIVEPVVIAVTEDGYIKNIPIAQYKASNKNKAFVKTSTDQLVILFSNLGKMYRVKVSKIKACGNADKGQAGGALLKLTTNERIIGCAVNNDEGDMLVVTSNNLIRRTPIATFSSTVQSLTGLNYYPIKDNEVITCVVKVFSETDTITVKTKTHALKFLIKEVTCTKSKTSKGMKCMNTQELIISAVLNEQNDLPLGKRAGTGKKI